MTGVNTPNFSGKLDELPATLDRFRGYEVGELADALGKGAGRYALAIGSGGSLIAAEYFARCRDSLGLGPTMVQAPMQAVLEHHGLKCTEVWLFSAGADNPDAVAAVHAVLDRDCERIHVVTRNPEGKAAVMAARCGGSVYAVPVTDSKDGYLATHSLISFATALLLACDLVSGEPHGAEMLLESVMARTTRMRDAAIRSAKASQLADLRRSDTVIVAADPLLRPLAVLLDTSLWEASLCAVQTTDFRNLAHGRHAWLHHRAADTFLLAATGAESDTAWSAIERVLPLSLRRLDVRFGGCGRLENVFGIIDGLGIVEAMGTVLEIDPGKPGIGDFGREMYDNRALTVIAEDLPKRVRHKRSAIARSDSFDATAEPLVAIGRSRLRHLAETAIGGVVFDYDGTIVATERRREPPKPVLIEQLVRLHAAGMRIAFATGRGGSVGERLREILPLDILSSILIGYYNGGHIRTADVDIRSDRPAQDPSIAETAGWLESRPDLLVEKKVKRGELQITLDHKLLRRPYRFALDLRGCPAMTEGRIRIQASGHSFDIVPATSSKLAVVDAIRARLGAGEEVLCFGDSGSKTGNDHELLSHPFGIGVGSVCGSAGGCWTLFGDRPAGPDAVLAVLRFLEPSSSGNFYLDVSSMGLDSR